MNDPIHLCVMIILSVLNGILMCFMAYKFLHTYQLNSYHMSRFLNWFKNTNGKYFLRLALISCISTAGLLVTNILFNEYFSGLLGYSGLIFYAVITIIFVKYEAKIPKKKPIVFTHRMRRLYVVLMVVSTATTFGLFNLSTLFLVQQDLIKSFRYVVISISPILLPIMVLISAYLILPFELLNNIRYKNITKISLKKRNDLIKIGITGSYAKTTVKMIITDMLSNKYRVLSTPASFNTPLGIAKSVKSLKSSHEVFIAEMGARYVGQIKELCDIVKPQYAVITGVSHQHLETFKSIENIITTKRELLDSLPNDGLAVINADSEYAKKTSISKVECIYSSLENDYAFATAKNIKVTTDGSTFTLIINGESIDCETKLLGKHNISNIVVSAALCYRLGITMVELRDSIKGLSAPAHRLELIRSKNGMIIIDDTFNANVDGTKAALEILSTFEGRKVIVTPGLVELGSTENSFNRQFGRDISKVCDIVILIGKNRPKPIKEGLLESGFDESRIYTYNSLSEAKKDFANVLTVKDVVLLENDLPDDYNEVESVS